MDNRTKCGERIILRAEARCEGAIEGDVKGLLFEHFGDEGEVLGLLLLFRQLFLGQRLLLVVGPDLNLLLGEFADHNSINFKCQKAIIKGFPT